MAEAHAPPGNVALLIDADNASPSSLDPVLTVLAELGTVNIRRIYGNWDKPALKGWAQILLRYGLEPQQQFDLTKGKNATDMKMAIDAMDLLFGGRVTGFGLMSSDSDFAPLAQRIRQDGLPVYGFGRGTTPEGFRAACTRFIDIGKLEKAHAEEQAAPMPAVADGPESDVLALLIDAYNAAKRDERGFASLADIGRLAGNRSSFDARNYGAKHLSDLVAKLPNFQTELRDGNRLYVKRLR
jgi:hypothetical protein